MKNEPASPVKDGPRRSKRLRECSNSNSNSNSSAEADSVEPKSHTMRASAPKSARTTSSKKSSRATKTPLRTVVDVFARTYKFGKPRLSPFNAILKATKVFAANQGVTLANALYPGSYVDVAPSLHVKRCVYVDTYKGNNGEVQFFFSETERANLLKDVLELKGPALTDGPKPEIVYYNEDYTRANALSSEKKGSFDLLISRGAGGDISKTCSSFVRPGGLLLVLRGCLYGNEPNGDLEPRRRDSKRRRCRGHGLCAGRALRL